MSRFSANAVCVGPAWGPGIDLEMGKTLLILLKDTRVRFFRLYTGTFFAMEYRGSEPPSEEFCGQA